MALFLDSAAVEDVHRALELGFIKGVTTNPALIAKVGRPGLDVLRDILAITEGPVFYQVTADTIEGREAQAREASAMAPERVFVKIPATTDNLSMAGRLSAEGVLCAITAVSHPSQAYLAVQVGAAYAIPYVNRLTRQLGDGIAVMRDVANIVKGTQTRSLAASLKSEDEVIAAVRAGAEDITIPLELILALGDHELSQQAIDDFASAMAQARS
jgi:transaldolase